MNVSSTKPAHFGTLLLSAMFCLMSAISSNAQPIIKPGAIWPDNRGQHIQAHGGGIFKLGDTFYWFGEDRSRDNQTWPALRQLLCVHESGAVDFSQPVVLSSPTPKNFGRGWILERPKVFYNAATKKFVMYFAH